MNQEADLLSRKERLRRAVGSSQLQYDRTPAIGEELVSGEHYLLIALLNKWKIYPNSRDEAIRIAEFLLTYCLEE